MDAGMAAGRNENLQTADLLNFSLEVDGKNEHARLTTLAPASALCVSNYTRYVKLQRSLVMVLTRLIDTCTTKPMRMNSASDTIPNEYQKA